MLIITYFATMSYLCSRDAQLGGAVGERPHQEGAVLPQRQKCHGQEVRKLATKNITKRAFRNVSPYSQCLIMLLPIFTIVPQNWSLAMYNR
jgi:hypothetical protein